MVASWISAHTQSWPIFLSAAVLLTLLASRAYTSDRARSIPWLLLAVWFAGLVALYVSLGVYRFLGYAPHLWSAQLATLAVVMFVPLALLVLTLVFWRRFASGARRSGSVVAALVGISAMTLTPAISLWMFRLLQTWAMLDRHRR